MLNEDKTYAVIFKLGGRSKTFYAVEDNSELASKKAERMFREKYPELWEEGFRQFQIMMVPEA